ncbi:MAG: hypothetical protein CMJ78_27255 [Planctomycetaceae bacterium]|nr:hypothetical protein [Planctomycetaceae bacterium]
MLPKKLTFQLTPLLDLLLIVIFAQFMEMRESTEREVTAAEGSIKAIQQQSEEDRAKLLAAQEQNKTLRNDTEDLKEELELQRLQLTESLNRAIKQRDVVGKLVAELFHVPEETIERALNPRSPLEQARSKQEIEKLLEQFRELSKKSGDDVVKHLLTYQEMTKRCDIWEVYVSENGTVQFFTPPEVYEFRASSADTFADRVFQHYKSMEQPKSLVIVLLSYGDAKAAPRQAALDGMPLVTDRMRSDSNGRSRFEYAVLGYNAEGPVSKADD